MKIIFDTQTKQFAITPSDEAVDLKGISEELCHNLVRLIQRPDHDSASHWLNEIYGFLKKPLSKPTTISRRPIEYMFNSVGNYMNSRRHFYLIKESIEILSDEVKNEPYGSSLELSDSIVAYGIWIFYMMFNPPKNFYRPNELTELLNKWKSIITEGNWEWESLSNVPRKSMRYYSYSKTYSWILNY